jgi:Leucine-rich repeat (LRR) protein
MDKLPKDVLELILGSLKRKELCTVRLVSKTFCAAASANVRSLKIKSTSQAISLQHFCRLRHVTLYPRGSKKCLAEVDPRLRDRITTLKLESPPLRRPFIMQALAQVNLLPNLQELEVDFQVQRVPKVLRHCTSLESLKISGCSFPMAKAIMSMTQLTALEIGGVSGSASTEDAEGVSWLQHATALMNLQALSVTSAWEALPLIGNLTALTGLTWLLPLWHTIHERIEGVTYSLAPLTGLIGLKSVTLGAHLSEENLAIACSLGSGSLVSLCLKIIEPASAACGRLLMHQTALRHLAITGDLALDLLTFDRLRINLLESLELCWIKCLDGAGLDALRKATSVTRLHLGTTINQPHQGLSQVLASLTQLRSLQLQLHGDGCNAKILDLSCTLSPLTGLTMLDLSGGDVGPRDLPAILVLTDLRELHLRGCRLTEAVMAKLTVLTNLDTLSLVDCGVRDLSAVTKVSGPLRKAMGWPPMLAYPEYP